jgi:hypothetical protein
VPLLLLLLLLLLPDPHDNTKMMAEGISQLCDDLGVEPSDVSLVRGSLGRGGDTLRMCHGVGCERSNDEQAGCSAPEGEAMQNPMHVALSYRLCVSFWGMS